MNKQIDSMKNNNSFTTEDQKSIYPIKQIENKECCSECENITRDKDGEESADCSDESCKCHKEEEINFIPETDDSGLVIGYIPVKHNNPKQPVEQEYKLSKETRDKMSKSKIGEKHWNWKGGITKDKKHLIELDLNWKKKNKDKVRAYSAKSRADVRNKVLFGYGGENPSCKCCGTTIQDFLCVDHINGFGTQERIKLFGKQPRGVGSSGNPMYRHLINKNFPEGYQLLCHNCNFFKSAHAGEPCPCRKEISKAKELQKREIQEIVLNNSHEEYVGASSYLLANTDKIMFAINNLK